MGHTFAPDGQWRTKKTLIDSLKEFRFRSIIWCIRFIEFIRNRRKGVIDPFIEPISPHIPFVSIPGMPLSPEDFELLEQEQAALEIKRKPSVEA